MICVPMLKFSLNNEAWPEQRGYSQFPSAHGAQREPGPKTSSRISMNTFTKNAARLLKGVAALSVAAVGLAIAPSAQAQSGTVTLTNCSATNGTMTGFTWNGSVLSVTCTAGTDPGPG